MCKKTAPAVDSVPPLETNTQHRAQSGNKEILAAGDVRPKCKQWTEPSIAGALDSSAPGRENGEWKLLARLL